MQAILTGMGARGTGHAQEHVLDLFRAPYILYGVKYIELVSLGTGHAQEHVLDGIFAALVGGNNLGRFKPRHIKRLCIQCRSNFSILHPSCVCFGWGPRHQTTGARVLGGAPGTKPQAHVLWVGLPAPNVLGSDGKKTSHILLAHRLF